MLPLTLVSCPVLVGVDPVPMGLVCQPLALVVLPIRVHQPPPALRVALVEITLILGAVLAMSATYFAKQYSLSVAQVINPLSEVRGLVVEPRGGPEYLLLHQGIIDVVLPEEERL